MLYFGLYVTFQPHVRHILANWRHILAHRTSRFGPVAMPTNEHPHLPTPTNWHGPKVIFGGKALMKK